VLGSRRGGVRWIPAVLALATVAVAVGSHLRLTTAPSAGGPVAAFDGIPRDPSIEAAPDTASVDQAIVPPPATLDGPAATGVPPAGLGNGRFRGVVPSGGTWAVMIGINDYPGSSHDLRSAVADADDVDLALARTGVPADHRLVVRDGQASARVVALAADWLVAHASRDAVAVFFYAGHVRKESRTTEAVVASDGRTVTDADLARHLAPLQARRAWIGIAACYGGGFTELMAPGRVLTAAAAADELAYENPSFGRSYMVQYMVRQGMIEGRAGNSVQAAFDYARTTIAAEHPGREPVELDGGGGPLVLTPPGASPAPVPAPRPASQPSPQPAPASNSPRPAPSGSGTGSGTGNAKPPDECTTLTLGWVHCND
jgi:Caspase domain